MTEDAGRQRIDKWLWFARVVKTRTLAQSLAVSGRVRLNGRRVEQAAQAVRPGDVLTIGIAGRVRVLRVLAFAARRGAPAVAEALFEDLAPPIAETPSGAEPTSQPDISPGAGSAPRRGHGEGRPTKRERRQLDRFTGRED